MGLFIEKMNEGMSIDRLLIWFHSNPFIFLTNDLLDECICLTYQEGWRFYYWEQQMLSETWGTFNNPFYTARDCYARASWNTYPYIRGTVNRQIQSVHLLILNLAFWCFLFCLFTRYAWFQRSIFQTFWKPDCWPDILFLQLETSNFGYLPIFWFPLTVQSFRKIRHHWY